MENQNKVYQEVAEECSQYCPCGCDHSVRTSVPEMTQKHLAV